MYYRSLLSLLLYLNTIIVVFGHLFDNVLTLHLNAVWKTFLISNDEILICAGF